MSGAANAALGTGTTGGAGTPGAAPGATAPAPAGGAPASGNLSTATTTTGFANPGSATVVDWTSGMTDDHKGYVQQKGFKDPTAVLDSYRNLEKVIGVPQERILKLPVKEDDPAWGEVYEKLGRPRDAKEYKIDVPKEFGDDKFADWARTTFHELNISKNAGEKLAGKWTEFVQNAQKGRVEAYNNRVNLEGEALKKEWGAAYEKHVSIAKHAASAFGIEGPIIDKLESAMGFSGIMKFFHGIGSKIGESGFVSGGTGAGNNFGNVMTPDAARGRIQALRSDPDFVRRYTAGELGAKEEFERLHKMAHPE